MGVVFRVSGPTRRSKRRPLDDPSKTQKLWMRHVLSQMKLSPSRRLDQWKAHESVKIHVGFEVVGITSFSCVFELRKKVIQMILMLECQS